MRPSPRLPSRPVVPVLLAALVALPLLAHAAKRPSPAKPTTPPLPAMGVGVTTPVPAPNPLPPPVHEEWISTTPGQEFQLTYDTDPTAATRLEVRLPERFGARVTDLSGRELFQGAIPANVILRPAEFFRVEIYDSARVFFDRRFEARPGMLLTLRVPMPGTTLALTPGAPCTPAYPPSQQQQPIVVVMPAPTPAPAPAPPPAPTCTSDADLREVIRAMQAESFGDGKLGVLRSAAPGRWFCTNQVSEIVEIFPFGEGKLDALRTLNPRIVDRQNNYKLISLFTFSSEKEAAKNILK